MGCMGYSIGMSWGFNGILLDFVGFSMICFWDVHDDVIPQNLVKKNAGLNQTNGDLFEIEHQTTMGYNWRQWDDPLPNVNALAD